jgi:phage gp37-like protein
MSLNDFRNAIVTTIKDLMPELRSVETHGGVFGAGELKRFATKAPGIRVALLSVDDPKPQSGGAVQWRAKCVAYVMTKNRGGLKRDVAALNIVTALVAHINDHRFGLTFVTPAKPVTARTLYSGELDKSGITLWAVQWFQTIELVSLADEDGTIPTDLYIGIAPDIGADHEEDYIHVGAAA